jgi:hypothetical protein
MTAIRILTCPLLYSLSYGGKGDGFEPDRLRNRTCATDPILQP